MFKWFKSVLFGDDPSQPDPFVRNCVTIGYFCTKSQIPLARELLLADKKKRVKNTRIRKNRSGGSI